MNSKPDELGLAICVRMLLALARAAISEGVVFCCDRVNISSVVGRGFHLYKKNKIFFVKQNIFLNKWPILELTLL
jgi:hypothetical protein